jgi:hypothetical protein
LNGEKNEDVHQVKDKSGRWRKGVLEYVLGFERWIATEKVLRKC